MSSTVSRSHRSQGYKAMKRSFRRIAAAGLSALLLLGGGAFAQEGTVTPTQPAAAPPPVNPDQTTYSPQQLDQLLAPVALYPDQLLGQILMASTYPLEVVEAARWLQDPHNAALKGDQLTQALDQQDWDPSVKALVPFPRVIEMMSQQLEWTQSLGNAFLAQQDQVMDSVQRLRQEALKAGNLRTTPQQVVQDSGGDIVISPAVPDVVYVPYYDPTLVYGPWAYAAYPPYFFPPPPGYFVGPGIFFGVSFPIVTAFWGWDDFDWHHHWIHVDRDRFNRIDRFAIARDRDAPLLGDTWHHDAFHRRGVAYAAPQLQQRFGAASRAAAAQHPLFGGVAGGQRFGNRPTTPQTATHTGTLTTPAWRGTTAPGAQPNTIHPQTAARPQLHGTTPQFRGTTPQSRGTAPQLHGTPQFHG